MTDATVQREPSTSTTTIALPDGAYPCAVCGIALAPSSPVVEHRVIHRSTATGRPQPPTSVPLGLCGECSQRRDTARGIATAHLRLGRSVGADRAVDAVEGVLIATRALGLSLPFPFDDGTDDSDLGLAIRHLGTAGIACAYRSRAALHEATAYPFAHLDARDGDAPALLASLRERWAALLQERIARSAPPVRLPPPPLEAREARASRVIDLDDGCLLCGASSVPMRARDVERAGGRAAAARESWSDELLVEARSLGASGAARVRGRLCATCYGVYDALGAIGPTAIERAFAAHLAPEALQRIDGAPQLDGLVAYAGLVARALLKAEQRPGPPSRPWGFVSDLDALAAALRSSAE